MKETKKQDNQWDGFNRPFTVTTNDGISYMETNGATGDAMLDVDDSASLEQVPIVATVQPPPSAQALSLDTAKYGGINQSKVMQGGPTGDTITIHQSVGEQPDIAGSLIKKDGEYSY
jgi:hypothetical protein